MRSLFIFSNQTGGGLWCRVPRIVCVVLQIEGGGTEEGAGENNEGAREGGFKSRCHDSPHPARLNTAPLYRQQPIKPHAHETHTRPLAPRGFSGL